MLRPDFSELVDVFESSANPMDVAELKRIFLGKAEAQCFPGMQRQNILAPWLQRRRFRDLSQADVLSSPVLADFFKELFNHYFREDLYGCFRDEKNIILSSGSARSPVFRLPYFMQWSLITALKRGWYGYSDSRGRGSAREALAELENTRTGLSSYSSENICLTLGGTEAISSIADFISLNRAQSGNALTIAPNYPPLVSAVADRFGVDIVPVSLDARDMHFLDPMIEKIDRETPLILLQTVINPSGTRVPEVALERLISATHPNTYVILDECHECFSNESHFISPLRARPNVIRVRSISKEFFSPGLKTGWFTASRDFIDSYYEYASTHFGGPASINYLMLELLGWFESWRLKGIKELSSADIGLMASGVGFSQSEIRVLYGQHLFERTDSKLRISGHIQESRQGLERLAKQIFEPDASINLLFEHSLSANSYSIFLQHLRRDKVSLYPGLLCFLPNNGFLRASPLVEINELRTAFQSLSSI